MKRALLLLCLSIGLAACSSIKNATVSMENLDQTAVSVHQSKLSDAEKAAFDDAKTRADNGEYDVTNKTVGQVIADQEAYDADQKAQRDKATALAAQARQRHDDQLRALQNAMTVGLVDKAFKPADYESGTYEALLGIQIARKNNSSKAIRATKGTLEFDNTLGDKIYSSDWDDEERLGPHQSDIWYGSIKYNEFESDLVRFKDAEMSNVRLRWIPETILFTDGTKLEVNQ